MAKATRAEWAKRVERWKDRGLTAKEFAAGLGRCWRRHGARLCGLDGAYSPDGSKP